MDDWLKDRLNIIILYMNAIKRSEIKESQMIWEESGNVPVIYRANYRSTIRDYILGAGFKMRDNRDRDGFIMSL